MRVLITGGAGFIGSALTRRLAREPGVFVLVFDKLTYAADRRALEGLDTRGEIGFVEGDIGDGPCVSQALADFQPDAIAHLAAESHVDRSIDGAADFVATNVVGVHVLLECATAYWRQSPPARRGAFRFLHMSTDEVFGVVDDGLFTPDSPYDPRSPYSASKAAGDHLVSAWRHTFGLPAIIANASNNYGPYQFPEKLIPLMILRALQGESLPVYGDGQQVRDWLHVDDHVEALWRILQEGRAGERFLIGARAPHANIDIVHAICDRLDGLRGGERRKLISHVEDRPGHDRRYAVDPSYAETRLGWRPQRSFAEGLNQTIDWYLAHEAWWAPLRTQKQAVARRGLARNPA